MGIRTDFRLCADSDGVLIVIGFPDEWIHALEQSVVALGIKDALLMENSLIL